MATFRTTGEVKTSQSTIKMDKGYYSICLFVKERFFNFVAIHNKNGQGLLHNVLVFYSRLYMIVAIHNKNGQGLLLYDSLNIVRKAKVAIHNKNGQGLLLKIMVVR